LLRLWLGFAFAAALAAQELAPIGIVRGTLLDCDSTHLTIGVEGRTFRFQTDSRTFIERDHMRIFCPSLKKGERIELVSDRSAEQGTRYARLVSVITADTRPRRQQALMALRAPLPHEDPTLSIAPRGSLTFTGVVLRLDADGLVLRTRVNGEKWILVRRDTRYREDGLQVEPANLRSSTRVFIRAGTNLDGEIEAYEVVWGEILAPAGLR
jgi:hypothetical protein